MSQTRLSNNLSALTEPVQLTFRTRLHWNMSGKSNAGRMKRNVLDPQKNFLIIYVCASQRLTLLTLLENINHPEGRFRFRHDIPIASS